MGSAVESLLYDAFKHWYRGSGGNIWFYSDPHFGDLDLFKGRLNLVPVDYVAGPRETKYMDINDPNKTYTESMLKQMLVEFDETQIKNINSCVGKNGTIVILGDVGNLSYVKRIKGYKILVCGNHDGGAEKYRRKVDEVISFNSEDIEPEDKARMQMVSGDLILSSAFVGMLHNKYSKKITNDNGLFDEVYKGCLMISDKIMLSHVPVDFEYTFNIHGHIHNKNYHGDDKHLNVCAEAINYMPISLTHIVRDLKLLANIKDANQEATNEATLRKNMLNKNL